MNRHTCFHSSFIIHRSSFLLLSLFAVSGCALTAPEIYRHVILPEQGSIEHRDPAQFPSVHMPDPGPARTLGNLGKLAPWVRVWYTTLRGMSVSITEGQSWQRPSRSAWTRSSAILTPWRIHVPASIRSIRSLVSSSS